MKNGSTPRVRAGRAMTSPTAWARRPGERPRGAAGPPTDFLRDADDALARLLRDPGLTVERVGHRTDRDAGTSGDVVDRRAPRAGLGSTHDTSVYASSGGFELFTVSVSFGCY